MKHLVGTDLHDLELKFFKATKIAAHFELKQYDRYNENKVALESKPIAKKSAIDKLMFKEIKVTSWGSFHQWEEGQWSARAYFQYEHNTGGSNGCDTGFIFIWSEANGWEVTQ